MEFLTALSDDQKALLGCVVALAGTSLLLIISNFIGKTRSKSNGVHNSTVSVKIDQPKSSSRKKAA